MQHRRRPTCVLPALILVIAMTTSMAQTPSNPTSSSAERLAILAAARAPVVQDLGKPIEFRVNQLNVLDGSAFLHATMLDIGGAPLSYAGTHYEGAAAHGMKSRGYAALLRESQGQWSVVAYVVGPTDVAWESWGKQYRVPETLFVLTSP
ncbi:MAG: hypothetical protein ABI843_07990 [Dokdonella sp.]